MGASGIQIKSSGFDLLTTKKAGPSQKSRNQKLLLLLVVKPSTSLVESKIASGDLGLNWLVPKTVIRRIGNCIKFFSRIRWLGFLLIIT